ncbi:MAG: hypothetical protein COB45_08420 [Gammaproteobacteria bacterium]|nr:hypothetical protein [Pseudomonas sp.]PCI54394.1 MAG: hypothetical protein COB45_08420 [Gammaproteobacteria bacterium]
MNNFKKRKAQLIAAGLSVFLSASAFADDATGIADIQTATLVGIAALAVLVLAVGGASVALAMGEKGIAVSKRNIRRV